MKSFFITLGIFIAFTSGVAHGSADSELERDLTTELDYDALNRALAIDPNVIEATILDEIFRDCVVMPLVTTREEQDKCADCEYVAKSNHLVYQQGTHQKGKWLLNCLECNYIAVNKSSLADHMYTHNREKPYKCGQCHYAATRPNHLTKHMLAHTRTSKWAKRN